MNDAKFAVMVKDGQGQFLDCGSASKAIKRASTVLGCKQSEIHIINAWNLDQPCYLFDSTDADAAYWLKALQLPGEPAYIGKPAQAQ